MVVDTISEADVDRIFQALADTTRRDIFRRVLHNGHSVTTLARQYDMSFAAIQKHVSVLERATLVVKEKHGREQIVRGNVPTLRTASTLLDAFEEIWLHRVSRIADILGEEGSTS